MSVEHERLKKRVAQQARRIKRAEEEKENLFAQTIYIGTLGLLFIVPTVGGAYLGFWLDSLSPHYSTDWTLPLLFAGVGVGILNVWLFIRE